VDEPAAIAAEMYCWEFAITTACHILNVNAFDQPNVEDHKSRTKIILEKFINTGNIDLPKPKVEIGGVEVFSNIETSGLNIKECSKEFVGTTKPHEFVAINAFLPRNVSNFEALTRLRVNIRNRTKCATTLGFGPRYLHSTGQLHKGGTNNGKFLLITLKPQKDVQIPTQELTFGELELAQALGDYQALTARDRRVMWINLSTLEDLQSLTEALS
jgi:transaldolase/glucose-6-phosphate isomerase